jgi:hypothetical protein
MTPDPHEITFSTANTQLACYITAAALLRYLRAERRPYGVEFLFEDPLGRGEGLRSDWGRGIVQMVNPTVLLATRNKLIDEVKRLTNGSPSV